MLAPGGGARGGAGALPYVLAGAVRVALLAYFLGGFAGR
jgi:hypothetical protein